MEHYHGTPITPAAALAKLKGRNFCVSYARPDNLRRVLRTGQRVMFDSGAFSAFTNGYSVDFARYERWLFPILHHPHWALIPDVIGGTVDEQRGLIRQWDGPLDMSCPVWHIHLPLDFLGELVDFWPRVAFGSSGEYWQVGDRKWCSRISEAWGYLRDRSGLHLPNIHMLRAMSAVSSGGWPFASADSSNVGRNHKDGKSEIADMADRIDCVNPDPVYYTMHREELL